MIITEIGLKTPKDCLGYRLITKMVEITADHTTNISKNVLPLKKQLNDESLNALQEMNEVAISSFETAIESLFRLDFDLAESVIAKANKIVSLEKSDTFVKRDEYRGNS